MILTLFFGILSAGFAATLVKVCSASNDKSDKIESLEAENERLRFAVLNLQYKFYYLRRDFEIEYLNNQAVLIMTVPFKNNPDKDSQLRIPVKSFKYGDDNEARDEAIAAAKKLLKLLSE